MCKFYQYSCLEHVLKTQNYINILNRIRFLDNHKVGTFYNHSACDTHYSLNVHLFCLCDFCQLISTATKIKITKFQDTSFTPVTNIDAKILKGTPMNYKNHALLSATMMPYVMGGQVNKLWEPQIRQEPHLHHEVKLMIAKLPKR